MVKNKFGGNKTKGKSRKSMNSTKTYNFEDLKKIDGQEYAFITKVLGDHRYEVMCYDKVKRMAVLCGRLKKKSSGINKNSCVLVSKREWQDDKCDVIAIFSEDDINKLVNNYEITSSFSKEGTIVIENDINDQINQIENDINDINNEDDKEDDDDSIEINIDDL